MAAALHPHLPITLIECRFEPECLLRPPAYAGSAWRGTYGHALKKTVCVARGTECSSCLLYHSCAYSYLFETPLPTNAVKMRRYTAAPHPQNF